jgi:hypothetical protein
MSQDFLGSGIQLPPASFSWSSSPTFSTSGTLLTGAAPTGGFNAQSVMGVASGIGGIFSAIGAMQSASAQKNQLKFQSDMSSLNAQNAKFMGDLNSKNSLFMAGLNSRQSSYIGEINATQALQVGEINARLAELAAETEMTRGQNEYGSYTFKVGRLKSTQRANLAANGVDLGVGSAAEVLTSTDMMREIEGQVIVSNAVRSAWGYQTQASIYRAKAGFEAVNARSGGTAASNNYMATGTNNSNNYLNAGNQAYLNASNTAAFTGIQADAISPVTAGATSLLGSATRAADTWFKYRRDSAISSKLGLSLD